MFDFDFSDPKNKTYICYGVVLIVAFVALWYLTSGMKSATDVSNEHFSMYSDPEGIDSYLTDMMPCSKSCCANYWPIPHMSCAPGDAICALVANNTYVPTNYSCANRDTSGCVCMTKHAWNFLAQRGNNITYDNYGDIMV